MNISRASMRLQRLTWLSSLTVAVACGPGEFIPDTVPNGAKTSVPTGPAAEGGGAPGSPGVGNPVDDPTPPQGPGLIIMGGGADVDAAFAWMHDTITGSAAATGGDIVVLRTNADNAYDAYIARLGRFNSVRTVVVAASATPGELRDAAQAVERAEGVFFAGGDQADYVGWNGTPLMEAVRSVHARGGVIGGTSAGANIQGSVVFDSISADAAVPSRNVSSADALSNPFARTISFTRDLFHWGPAAGVIFDPHFRERDRMGRLLGFVARQYADGAVGSEGVTGVGVDEDTALLVDKTGTARVVRQSSRGAAYVVRAAGPADTCIAGQPLVYKGVRIMRLDAEGQTYDFGRRCGTGASYVIDVDGSIRKAPYAPPSPYTLPGTTGTCN